MKKNMRYPGLAAVVFASAVTASGAHAYSLQPQQTGNVTYLTGGIGDEERDALKTVKNDYNFSLMSASKAGEFVGNTQVVIKDRQGNQLVNTYAGPMFYAQLPPGRYTVQAISEGQSRSQNITIAQGRSSNVHFSWN